MTRSAKKRPISRREFVQAAAALGVTAGLAPLAAACSRGDRRMQPLSIPTLPTTTPDATAVAARTTVAFVKTTDRAAGVRQALALLQPAGLAGRRVAVKPNFNSADPTPGSTHPDVLRTLIDWIQAQKPQSVTVADRSGMGNTRAVLEQRGIVALAKELGVELVVLDELAAGEWELINLPSSHWRQGFPMARLFRQADAVVQTCCLKTHRFGGHFTLSLKNSVGMVAKQLPGNSYNYMSELHGSPHQRRMIAEINAAYAPAVVVLDGVTAFVDGGPDKGKQVDANVVLAGTDRVAVDAVGVALLRHFGSTPEVSQGPIFGLDQIARAVELGLGVSGPQQIDLATADADSAAYAHAIAAILAQG